MKEKKQIKTIDIFEVMKYVIRGYAELYLPRKDKMSFTDYDIQKCNPPEIEIEENNDDIRTHRFIDNREKIAEEFRRKFCNYLTIKEILQYKYYDLIKFYERNY